MRLTPNVGDIISYQVSGSFYLAEVREVFERMESGYPGWTGVEVEYGSGDIMRNKDGREKRVWGYNDQVVSVESR